jgi:hypothetical protein
MVWTKKKIPLYPGGRCHSSEFHGRGIKNPGKERCSYTMQKFKESAEQFFTILEELKRRGDINNHGA